MTTTLYLERARELFPEAAHSSYFPEAAHSSYFSAYDYSPIVTSLGTPIVVVNQDDYQGDTWAVLGNDEGQYGYLNFGWGSCSGCDSLQGCASYDDVADLIERLANSIQWQSKQELASWFDTHDWEGDYSWSDPQLQTFLTQATAALQS